MVPKIIITFAYRFSLIFLLILFSANVFARTQGDGCESVLDHQHISGEISRLVCWYGTSKDDVIYVDDDSNVVINQKIVGVYNEFAINVFLGYAGDDHITGGSGYNVIFGMKGNDRLSGGGTTIIISGPGEDMIDYRRPDLLIVEVQSEDIRRDVVRQKKNMVIKYDLITKDMLIDIINKLSSLLDHMYMPSVQNS